MAIGELIARRRSMLGNQTAVGDGKPLTAEGAAALTRDLLNDVLAKLPVPRFPLPYKIWVDDHTWRYDVGTGERFYKVPAFPVIPWEEPVQTSNPYAYWDIFIPPYLLDDDDNPKPAQPAKAYTEDEIAKGKSITDALRFHGGSNQGLRTRLHAD